MKMKVHFLKFITQKEEEEEGKEEERRRRRRRRRRRIIWVVFHHFIIVGRTLTGPGSIEETAKQVLISS